MKRSPEAQARNVAATREARKTKGYKEKRRIHSREWRRAHPRPTWSAKAKRGGALRQGRFDARKGGYVGPVDAPLPVEGYCDAGCGRWLRISQMHLDHDHKTGAFRGWVCRSCNHGIGMLGDSIEGVKRALNYLRNGPQRRGGSTG